MASNDLSNKKKFIDIILGFFFHFKVTTQKKKSILLIKFYLTVIELQKISPMEYFINVNDFSIINKDFYYS